MFDVGFSEMIVIAVVALLVIGPEKLPSVARTVGALLGRMQRYVNDVKADINREIELDELKKMHTSVKEAAHSIESSVKGAVSSFEAQGEEMNAAIRGDSSSASAIETAGDAQMSDADLAAAIRDAETQAAAMPAAMSDADLAAAIQAEADTALREAAQPAGVPAPAPATTPATTPAAQAAT